MTITIKIILTCLLLVTVMKHFDKAVEKSVSSSTYLLWSSAGLTAALVGIGSSFAVIWQI